MSAKTNAIRLVQQAKFPCRESFYEYDETDLSGLHAATAIGMPAEQVYKTLVTRGDRTGIQIFCIPVCCDLDLKKCAHLTGNKKVELIHVRELPGLTGYIRGGCSPVGMKKRYPTYFEETCQLYDEIAVSAGERGHQMILSPQALTQLTDGQFADLILQIERK